MFKRQVRKEASYAKQNKLKEIRFNRAIIDHKDGMKQALWF